jgi:hypothetical protein
LGRLFHSQLVHFFALGALVFVAYEVLNDEPAAPSVDTIELTEAQAGSLVDNFSATWNRRPTATELKNLMQAWVLEEVYVREALDLGLDRGDAVIRQRLNQKMRFLAESGAAALSPSDTELQAFIEAHPDRFTQPARMAFEQIVLASDRSATEALALLNAGADPSTLAPPSLLPASLPLTPAPVIDRTFGSGFHEQLVGLPVGDWQGPVTSGYGKHLIRVTGTSAPVLPPLSDIRDRVEAEWRASEMTRISESFAETLLQRYTVRLPEADEVLQR